MTTKRIPIRTWTMTTKPKRNYAIALVVLAICIQSAIFGAVVALGIQGCEGKADGAEPSLGRVTAPTPKRGPGVSSGCVFGVFDIVVGGAARHRLQYARGPAAEDEQHAGVRHEAGPRPLCGAPSGPSAGIRLVGVVPGAGAAHHVL